MNQPMILGADGKPASPEEIQGISAQMSEQHRLKAAEFNQMVQNWNRFYSCESVEAAASTFKGQEFTNNGVNKEDLGLIHRTVRLANQFFDKKMPNRDDMMFRVCEAIMALLSGHPGIVQAPETLATIACVKSGAINIKEDEES